MGFFLVIAAFWYRFPGIKRPRSWETVRTCPSWWWEWLLGRGRRRGRRGPRHAGSAAEHRQRNADTKCALGPPAASMRAWRSGNPDS